MHELSYGVGVAAFVLAACGGSVQGGSSESGGSSTTGGGGAGGGSPASGGSTATGGAPSGGVPSGGVPGGGGVPAGGSGPCTPVGGQCDYFAPNCCAGLECSIIGVCSEVASCAGQGEPCGGGCCDGLECAADGTCAPPPPPSCAPGTNVCTACIASACCAQIQSCEADPTCAAALACFEQCVASGQYLSSCATQCGTSAPGLQPVGLCGYQNCQGACV